MADAPVLSDCYFWRNPRRKLTGVLEHCSEGGTNCSPFWGCFILTPSLRWQRTLIYISLLTFIIQCVPLATKPGWLVDCCSMSQQLGALQTHTTDTHYRPTLQTHTLQTHTTGTFLFISHTTNVPLFKFRCNIFIGVRIIKEMPGSVASGTPCITHS
jgi:hypothetical protein